jgi:DNA polymerase-3 subunit epsilon
MRQSDPCGCFPTGRHYPGIAHLLKVRAQGTAVEQDASGPWLDYPIALIDTETTGRDATTGRIVEIGIAMGQRGEMRTKGWLINPGCPIPKESTAVHGITDADVEGKPSFAEVIPEIIAFVGTAIPAAYNATFDRAFVFAEIDRAGARPDPAPPWMRREVDWIDPLILARELYKHEERRGLSDMTSLLGIELAHAHRAAADAEAALRVLYVFAKDPRIPRAYGALVQEQRRLARIQDEARRSWRKPS